jgi:hypothetical protein
VSEADNAPAAAAQIRAIAAELDRSLRRLQLPRSDRRTIVDEVRGDLQTAAADGVDPETLIGPDIDAFAREAVEAGGYRPRPYDYPRILAGGILAAGVTLVAAYLLIVELLQPALASWFTLDGDYPTAGPVVVLGGIAVVGVLGTLGALAWLLAGRPAARETVRRAALLTPFGLAVGIAAAFAVARDPGYAVTVASVSTQVALVALPVVAALGISRWWAVRAASDHDEEARPEHVTA